MLIVALLAQAAVAAAPAPAAAPQQGVISYPPAFFEAQHPGTTLDMVERLPGFSIDSGSGARGYEASAGNVLIDGRRPATKTDSLEEILKRLPASAVERIDVIRGGAPGIDMQGKSVIANVIRKKGNSFRGLLAVANNHAYDGRNAAAMRAEASGGFGDTKWEFGSFYGKGIFDDAGDGPGTHVFADGRPTRRSQIDSEGDVVNGQLTGALEHPLFGGVARINGRWAREKDKIDERDYILAPVLGIDGSYEADRIRETELGLNFNRDFAGGWNLELVGLRHPRTFTVDNIAGDLATGDRFQLDRHTVETIGRGVLKYRYSDRLSLEAGAEDAINTLDSDTSLSSGGAAIPLPAAMVKVREDRAEAFTKAVWRLTDRWTLDGGLRYERSKITSRGDVALEKTLTYLKPRATLIWAPVEGRQVRLRVEREVGQLNFDDFVASANFNTATGVTAGNPDLNPEQAWVGEATVEQRFWKDGLISVSYRHYDIKDAIDRGPVFTTTSVFDQPENIGSGRKDELAFELSLPLDRLGVERGLLKGDLTKRWSRVTDPTTGRKREISGLHPIDWNASFSQDLPRWNALWGVDVYGGWRRSYYRFNLIEDQKLRTFVRPYAEWRPRPDLNVRIELPNLTNRGFRNTDRIYPGPRNLAGQPDVEDRDIDNGSFYYIRIRKTFGG
jgi:outer membrane receptor protein involved in Fe transport